MKKSLSMLAAIALFAAMLPMAFAQQDQSSQPSSSQPSATQPSATSPQSSPDQGSSASQANQSSFTGTVVNANGKYVLKTDSGTYQLDDQDKAKQFEGKQVTVTGSLDSATSVLHVANITPASGSQQ